MNVSQFAADISLKARCGQMINYIAEMPSYTYGSKADKLLRSRGHHCELVRREGECGYDLHIYDSDDTALKILDRYAIPYKLKADGGGQ